MPCVSDNGATAPISALTYAFSIGSDRGIKADDSAARIIAGRAKRGVRVNRIDKFSGDAGQGVRAGRNTCAGWAAGGGSMLSIGLTSSDWHQGGCRLQDRTLHSQRRTANVGMRTSDRGPIVELGPNSDLSVDHDVGRDLL